MLTFKTLAEFRRVLAVGMRFECTHLAHRELSGSRVVTRVQSNALACRRVSPCPKCAAPLRQCATGDAECIHCDACGWCGHDPDVYALVRESWAYFPSAKLVQIGQRIGKGSEISFCDPVGRVVFTYHSFRMPEVAPCQATI